MQKIKKKKKHVQRSPIALLKAAQRLAVHTESFFPSTLCLESSAPFSVALRLAHIETQAQIALRQLTALAALTFGSSRLIATHCPQRAVLTLSTDLNQKRFRDTHLTMYHHHQQQPGSQPFPSGPPPNQPPAHPSADMMPPPVGAYQFPRPTQLPDELESALSIRGSRDMDHRLIEHLDRLSRLQNQTPGSAMGQHGNYGTNTQPKQQSVDWSSYEPPSKLFSSHAPGAALAAQHPAGHAGTSLPNWNTPVSESSVPNPRGRSFYTPESAGTILASFGLSNEDLEALSHYPDDQLTPDTLPFILRDLQVHKTGKPKGAPSRSPEVPSLLTVTQTEGRVIDYGHASQAKEESGPPKTFKKEPLSNERTVKMYPAPAPKLEHSVGRQVRLEPTEPIKHGDRDYRRRSSEHHTSRSPPPLREFSTKQRHQDRDYRQEPPKPRASAEKRSVEPPVSKPRPAPKPARIMTKATAAAGSKKLPTPTMINDFSGVPPKVYPHTCSLCDMQCDQEKDWVEHLETVNHTAACRHLRTKYPNWKPKVSSREYGGRTADHKRHSAGHSRSTSWSPPPPSDKPRGLAYKPRGKAYAPHQVPRHHPYHSKDVDGRFERPHSHGASHFRRPPFREHWEKREPPEGSSRMFVKRPHYDTKRFTSLKGDFTKKPQMKSKSLRPESGKQAEDGPPAKKRKAAPPLVAHDPECLVYLTDIPKEATEQEVINLAGSFGPINNVLLMPFPDDEEQKDQCLQASVCMMKAEDARTFSNAPNLLIRDRVITATVAKIPEESFDADGSAKPEQDGAGADHVLEKKGVVLIEELPESGWTEDDLKALAEPFGYPDDVIAAKQIKKAVLIFPDMAAAAEMVKVHAFSPLTVNGHKLIIKQFSRNISINTPVALYNCFMQSTKPKGTSWSMLIVVSNVPSTPSAASVVHKLVSRIGTVLRSLAVKNLVICELANGPLGAAVYRHYLKFPCMIQNNPLVFSRKPDPKPQTKVIPSFLDADREVPEIKKEAETTPAGDQNQTGANPEPRDEPPQDVEMKSEVKGEMKSAMKSAMKSETKSAMKSETKSAMKSTMKSEPTEVTVNEANAGIKETPEPVKEAAEQTEPEDVKTETPEQTSDAAPTEEETGDKTTTATPPKENGTQVQPAEDAKVVMTTGGEAAAQETPTEAKDPKAVAAEQKSQVKPSKKPPAPGKKQASAERSKDPAKTGRSGSSGREEERRRAERDRREREFWDRERRERDRVRKERDHEEHGKRDHERERRGDPRREEGRRDDRRDEMRREWRREWERREGRRKPFEEGDHRRGDSSKRSHHSQDRQRSDSRRSTTEEEDFPFDLSDFVTVDEVGDIDSEAPNPDDPTETAPEPEPTSQSEETPQESEQDRLQEADEVTALELNTEEPEVDKEVAEAEAMTVTEVNTEAEEQEETKDASAPTAGAQEGMEEEPSAVGDVSEVTEAPCPSAAEETSETNQEESNPPQQDAPEVPALTAEENEENKEEKEEEELLKEEAPAAEKDNAASEKQETETTSAPPAAEPEQSESGEKDVSEDATSKSSDNSLPPFDPNSAVGLEYLVPMTGFFCKVCTRFFTGAKDTQISHSKSLKHYENLEKFLKRQSSSAADAGST